MKNKGPLFIVLTAFIVACIGLLVVGLLPHYTGALPGFRAAVQVLAGGLVSIVSNMLGRRHSELPCPICRGVFPSDQEFKEHHCARVSLEDSTVGGEG